MKRDIKKMTALMVAGVLMVMPVGVNAEKGTNVENSNKIVVEQTENKYISFTGQVTEAADNIITVKENDNAIMFHLGTMIIGTKDGQIMEAKDIKAGDKITAVYTTNTPMALSYPGQMTPNIILVQNSDNSIKVDKFNEDMVSSDGSLKLITDDNTKLEAYKTKQVITQKDLKNKDLLVIYGATTRSIPAQTLVDGVVKVMVLPSLENEKVESQETDKDKDQNLEGKTLAASKIAIAKEAKAMGYKVNWNPKTKVVVISKAEDVIEIYVGTTKYRVNGMEKTAVSPANLEKGTTFVSSEILDYLKK